jgi:hypothetical protein
MKNATVRGRHAMRCAAFVLIVGAAGAFALAAAAAQAGLPAGSAPASVPQPAPSVVQRNPIASPTVPTEATPDGPPKTYDPSRNCVDLTDANVELRSGRRPVGGPIIYDHLFLPTGDSVDIGLDQPFVEGVRYFGYIYRNQAHELMLFRSNVLSRRAGESDPLVDKGLLEKDRTIVNLRIPDKIAGFWGRADLYIYTCGTNGSPALVSRLPVRLSPSFASKAVAVGVVILVYVLAAFLFSTRRADAQSVASRLSLLRVVTGKDGKASLSNFQILFFTMIVFGLILYLVLRTGMLAELSSTIMLLLGITGFGSTLAKGADSQRNAFSAENRAWLMQHGWIPTTPVVRSDAASWRDLITTEDEFDVYRFQSLIFSIVVGLALIAGGVVQLSTFAIPQTILGILGLSQAVYISGKLVTPTTMTDLNGLVADLRTQEKKLQGAARTAKPGGTPSDTAEAVNLVGPDAYAAYVDKAKEVSGFYTALTGISVTSDNLNPKFA